MPILQNRQKWLKTGRNFTVGDFVLIVDDNVKRGHRRKGIISEVYSDKDGLVRRVLVNTANSSMLRNVGKLCLIEAAASDQ